MKVELIQFTGKGARNEQWAAADLLIFTKHTRLNMTPETFANIEAMSTAEKLTELEYMADTIPSSWEFCDYVFCVQGVSRAYTHQQVRTRTGSFAQQSMRVTDQCEYDFVMPEGLSDVAKADLEAANKEIKFTYAELRKLGVAAEDARSILPTNIATNIVCKFNLRTLAELARSRTGGRTQGEYQAVVRAMIDEVLKVHPWAAKFLEPKGRDYFAEIEAFAKREFPDLLKRGELLKIVDKLRKEA